MAETLPATRLPYLVGDIGGTNARFGIFDGQRVNHIQVLRADDHPQFVDAVAAYLADLRDERPTVAAFAVAGPILGDSIDFTNRGWSFSASALAAELGFDKLLPINDFQALSMSLPYLTSDDLHFIGPHREGRSGRARAVLGPGTGLGMAGLIPVDGRWHPLPGEGGHVSFAPCDALEERMLTALRPKLERVSNEDLLSGPGMERIHQALRDIGEHDIPPRNAPAITQAGLRGEPDAALTLDVFCAVLGSVAGDLALVTGARGGIYIAGGIAPRIRDILVRSRFRERFEAKGRMAHFVKDIPTYLITADNPAFIGAAACLAEHLEHA